MEILFFVEDPGAANFIEEIPQEIAILGIKTKLLATNFASKQLKIKNIEFEEVNSSISAKNIILKYKPKLLVVGTSQNPKSLALDLIDYAKIEKIPSIGFIDSAADADLRFSGMTKVPLKHAPDWILVPDKLTKSLFSDFGYRSENIIITGNPNYNRIIRLRKKLEEIGLITLRKKYSLDKKNNPVVIFIDEHSNEDDDRVKDFNEYSFLGRPGASYRNEIIVGEVLDAFKEHKISPYFIVRLHPKSNGDDYKNIKSEIQRFSYDCDPYELIFCSDLIIGMTSILLMESLLLGKEVMSIIPREIEKEWAPPGLLENINCITTPKELSIFFDSIFGKGGKTKNKKLKIENNPNGNIINFLWERISILK